MNVVILPVIILEKIFVVSKPESKKLFLIKRKNVQQSHYRPGEALRFPGV
jgi:hypothetical protein